MFRKDIYQVKHNAVNNSAARRNLQVKHIARITNGHHWIKKSMFILRNKISFAKKVVAVTAVKKQQLLNRLSVRQDRFNLHMTCEREGVCLPLQTSTGLCYNERIQSSWPESRTSWRYLFSRSSSCQNTSAFTWVCFGRSEKTKRHCLQTRNTRAVFLLAKKVRLYSPHEHALRVGVFCTSLEVHDTLRTVRAAGMQGLLHLQFLKSA